MTEGSLNRVAILVVDDDQDTRDLLKFLLEDDGAIVKVTQSAKEALIALEDFAPDIIVSDLGMPEVNGYDLIQQIRMQPMHGETPAIALSAYARDEDRDRALAAGFNDYLAKPVDPLTLVGLIQQHCSK